MKYLPFLMFLFIFSCQQSEYSIPEDALEMEESITVESPRTAQPPPPPAIEEVPEEDMNTDYLAYNDQSTQKSTTNSTQPITKKVKKKIIRTADMQVEVTDYQEGITALRIAAKRYGAEISSESEGKADHRWYNRMIFRLSPENFDDFITSIEELAEIVPHKTIAAQDVTKQYLDVQTRLEAREATIKRYQEILQEAKNVTEILSVERELRRAIEERDALKGEIKYLNDRIGRSTVTLDIYQELEYSPRRRGFFSRVGHAFTNGWNGFLEFAIGLVSAWPFVLILIILLSLFIRYRKRKMS